MVDFQYVFKSTLPPIIMAVENGVLEDVLSLQMGYFPLNHDYGRKMEEGYITGQHNFLQPNPTPRCFHPSIRIIRGIQQIRRRDRCGLRGGWGGRRRRSGGGKSRSGGNLQKGFSFSNWWLNQPCWKICSSNWLIESFHQIRWWWAHGLFFLKMRLGIWTLGCPPGPRMLARSLVTTRMTWIGESQLQPWFATVTILGQRGQRKF